MGDGREKAAQRSKQEGQGRDQGRKLGLLPSKEWRESAPDHEQILVICCLPFLKDISPLPFPSWVLQLKLHFHQPWAPQHSSLCFL